MPSTTAFQRPSPLLSAALARACNGSEAELRESRLAGQQLGEQDAGSGKHRKAAVVQLTLLEAQHPLLTARRVRVLVEDTPAGRVAEVAHLLVWVLLPEGELRRCRESDNQREANGAWPGVGGGDATRHVLHEAEGCHALHEEAGGGHHGHATVLELSLAQLAEAGLVADLAEAEGVEKTQGRGGTHLLRGVERRGRGRRLLIRLSSGRLRRDRSLSARHRPGGPLRTPGVAAADLGSARERGRDRGQAREPRGRLARLLHCLQRWPRRRGAAQRDKSRCAGGAWNWHHESFQRHGCP
mmetsp:Transcript_13896/g.31497  ORF Transcript_13896/g.31497 Transcript_13896/m.31497 type:complete len:298 (-) Transcript_13896:64-957(-)